jgi:DHA1 family inner membrane transport protein
MATNVQRALMPERPARWLALGLALATSINHTSGFGLGPFLPVIAEELGTPVFLLGQIPAGTGLLAALLGLVVGPLADHFGYRGTLIVSLLCVVASAAATGLAPTFPFLLLVTLVGSVGRAAVTPVAQSIAATRYREEDARRRALSLITVGSSCAIIFGLPLLTTIASFSDWRIAYFLLGGATLGIACLLSRLLPPDSERPTGRPSLRRALTAYTPLRHHRPTLCLLGASLLGSTGLFAIWSYVAVFLTERYGLGHA